MRTYLRLLPVAALLAVGLTSSANPAGATASKSELKQARSVLIRHSDLPPGWTTSKSNNSNSNTGNSRLAKCMKVPVSLLNYNPPSVYSPQFNDKSAGLTINDSVAVYSNSKMFREQYRVGTSTKVLSCTQTMFNAASSKKRLEKSIGSGAKVGHVSVKQATPAPCHDKSFAVMVTIPFTVSGKTFSMTMLTVMIASRLRVVSLTFTSILGIQFPSSFVTQLETISVQRLG